MAEGRNPLPDADGPQLQVDVRERFYASGRLPTHRPDRREASASERELLAARCVDRALRPLFPPGALYEVQVTATVLAADGGTDSAVAAINAASAALALSEAPWSGPASAVRVAAVRGGGGGDGSGSGKGNDDNWDILVDPPAAAAVGGPLPRRAGPGAPWPMLTSGPLLMAAGAAASGPPGRHNHPHHNPPPPIPPTCGLLLTYAGTSRGDVLMLEAQGAPAPESVVVAALRRAEAEALLLAEAQLALVRRGGRPKARLPLVWPADDLTRAVEELARPELEAVFSSSSPQDGRGGSVGEKDPWGVVFWKTAKERRSAALGALQGKVMQGLAAQGLLPDAHSMPSASVAAASASGSRTHPPTLHSPADAARALDLLTSRVMREALLAGYGRGTGLVDPRSSAARPSAVLPPTDAPAAAPAAPAAAPAVPVGSRADGRHPWTLRYVASEVGVLPRVVHGSALFDRGDTQCLATATVAADRDAAQGESPHGRSPRRLMLHYSFPPFSVGEVGRMMGAPPNRREVGHGALAEKALAPLMPPSHVFPFCVRLSAETLSSSGSSSMAAVCAGSAAMRAAGVPLVDDVAGVSVGLVYERAPQLERGDKEWAGEAAAAYGRGGGGGAVLAPSSSSSASASATVADDDGDVSDDDVSDEGDDDSSDEANDENQDQQPEDEAEAGGGAPERALLNARLRAHRARHRLPPHPRYGRGLLLTDIEGLEDHHGDMDFKVAGTIRGGVTAIQLDTKLPGVPREALERALKGPALTARRTIALVNRRAQFQSRERLPPRAKPKHGTISIARELVPRLIGVGGCNLESIEAATGGRLAVAETGEIAIYAPTASQWDHAATACLEVEGGSVVEGGVYRVKVVRVVDYGCFVSLPSGMPALLHISELEHRRLRDVHEAVKEGEEFDVLCLGKDNKGMVQLSRRALMPRPPRAAGEGGGPGPAVAGSGGNGGNENAANSGSTQQSVWTLPSDREYTPEEAAAAAEAALGLKEEEEEEDDDEGEGESDKTTTKRRRRRRE
jgi:polyribonucleotide nucleotidyltransferase